MAADHDSHLWAYLSPRSTNPRVLRIDFWRLTPTCVLGRDPVASQVILPGPHISGRHATLEWNCLDGNGSKVTLQDHSSGGTWVNGAHIHNTKVDLPDGAEIGFGAPVAVPDYAGLYDYRFQFHSVSARPPLEKIDELYTKKKILGSGSYGSVYSAVEKSSGRPVAIKCMQIPLDEGYASTLQTCLTEITALQNIQHPHVIKIFAVHNGISAAAPHAEAKPTIFMVLELMPQSLIDYMNQELENQHQQLRKQKNPIGSLGLPENKCREIMYQLCHAMAHMHMLGITHRDLKPDNILIDLRAGVPFIKVADFGVAKIQKDLSRRALMTTRCGSSPYVAPEVDDPRNGYDHYADSFSAGVVCFSMAILADPWSEPRIPQAPLPKMRWEKLTIYMIAPEGVNFIEHLVQPDPRKRLSLTGALTHRWLTDYTPENPVSL